MKSTTYLILLYVLLVFGSCKKQDEFLNAKPNDALIIPTKLEDYELLLYNESLFNTTSSTILDVVSSDEYYVTDAWFNGLPNQTDKNAFSYAKEIYSNETNPEWDGAYSQIYYCNTILEGIEKLKISDDKKDLYNRVKGQALFLRAFAYFNLAQVYTLPYDSSKATTLLGLPIRVSSDINIKVGRSNLEESYQRILTDLQTALPLTPVITPFPTQPSKTAINALLAKVYLSMGKYALSFQYADAALALNNSLTDYNTLVPTNTYLSSTYLPEVVYATGKGSRFITLFSAGGTRVDTTLFSLYNTNDLRKSLLYVTSNSNLIFRGSYLKASSIYFGGLATDELFLTRAECLARSGNTAAALTDLNALYQKRWKNTVAFIPLTATSASDALQKILLERRKELPFRGARWMDVRRLNTEGIYTTTFIHGVNGAKYMIGPKDPRFALPLPDQEIKLTGVQQNPR